MRSFLEAAFSFFISSNETTRFRNNFISSLLMLLLVFVPDVILSITDRSHANIHVILTAIIVMLCFFLSFSGLILKLLIALCVFIAQFSQLNYAFVTGFALDPVLVSKIFFDDTGDFLDQVGQVWHIDLIYFLCFVFYVVFNFVKRKSFYFSPLVVIASLIGVVLFLFGTYKRDLRRIATSPTRQTIRNSIPSYAFFLMRKKDINELDNSLANEVYTPYSIKKITSDTPRIIVIFMGESTNANDMSLINKQTRETTALLEKFAKDNDKHFVYTTAVSGAPATIASHTLFFNIVREPGNVGCVKSLEHNLFKMAKENGYKTHWLSTQGVYNADCSAVSADDMWTKEKNVVGYKTRRDDVLLERFKETDLSKGKHLIVINPRTVHSPYYENYKHRRSEFEYYTDDKTKMDKERSAYHNSVRYLDWLLSELLITAVSKDVDYFFITSDHGELIGTEGVGHGMGAIETFNVGHNVLDVSVVYVPLMIYSKNNNATLFNTIKEKKLITHYDVSKMIAKLIGYDIYNPNEKENEFFIHDSRVTGNYRFIPCSIKDGVAECSGIEMVQTYMKGLLTKSKKRSTKTGSEQHQ